MLFHLRYTSVTSKFQLRGPAWVTQDFRTSKFTSLGSLASLCLPQFLACCRLRCTSQTQNLGSFLAFFLGVIFGAMAIDTGLKWVPALWFLHTTTDAGTVIVRHCNGSAHFHNIRTPFNVSFLAPSTRLKSGLIHKHVVQRSMLWLDSSQSRRIPTFQ